MQLKHIKVAMSTKNSELHLQGKEKQILSLCSQQAAVCFFSNILLTIKHGLELAEEKEKRRDSLVAVEDQLRLLGDLPHPHRAVPPSRRHAALAAQTVQACDGALMAEATERLSENLHLAV